MNLYLLAFLASLLYVGRRSVQQLNVQHKLYYLIPPFSLIMATLDIYVVSTIVKHDMSEMWLLVLALGGGGAIGSCAATYLHDKHLTKEK